MSLTNVKSEIVAILEKQIQELYSLVDDRESMNKALKFTLSPALSSV